MKQNKLILVLILLSINVFAQNITINGIRNFTLDENTILKKDGVILPITSIDIIGTGGFKVRFSLNSADSNQTLSQGTFTEINFISDIKGIVTSVNPLSIMDQIVFTTADTVYKNIGSADDLLIGDLVSISGIINENDNSMQLTRLESESTLNEWKVRGFARNISNNAFTIGNLNINSNGIMATNCLNQLVENSFVEIKASTDINYSAGQPLTTLTQIECQTPDVDEGSVGVIPTVVEGVISEIIDLSSFKINDLTVFFDITNTSFDNGEFEHLDVGTKIEVQGFLDTNTRFIDAATIRFIHHRIKMTAPISPSAIELNNSITVFGKKVYMLPATRDDDDIMSDGLIDDRQVEVRGFIDSDGQMYGLRVKDKGSADATETKLRGDITSINKPFLSINNINIDASNTIFEMNEETVGLDTFFAHIQIGMQISIENANYDINQQTLSLGEMELVEEELEDDPDETTSSNIKNNRRDIIGTGGVGIATITGTEIIFNSSFE